MGVTPNQIESDLRGTFRGRLQFDAVTRGLYSTDGSPFQITPLGVAVPEDEDDVATLVAYCAEKLISVIPRGAGTGVAGESLGPGLVVDLSQSFRRIVAIGADSVIVQPGVVHAELNEALAKVGRRFAPDPASSTTCTLGGMVATNASGANTFRHGYTQDHVLALRTVWDNGEKSSVGRTHSPVSEGTRVAEIVHTSMNLLTTQREAIQGSQPRTPFNRCGYRLHDVLSDGGLDLPKLLTGSEGTLAIITEATLKTIPLPGGNCHVLLGFGNLDAAVRAGLDLRDLDAMSCDLLDQRLLSLTRGGRGWSSLVPPGVGAALVAAWEADTQRQALERAEAAIAKLRENHRLAVLVEPTCEPEGVKRIVSVRASAVAGMYAMSPGSRPVSAIEDVGVPAEALPEYLTQVQDIMRGLEISGSLLVHVLTGQVHARPLLDMNRSKDREKLWPLAEAVHALALSLGGTVSTQHGTGLARTPWVEKQYGPAAAVFRELKRIFDPRGILNPGKIVGPDPSRPAWPLRSETRRPESSAVRTQEPDAKGRDSGIRDALAADTPFPTPLLVWSAADEPIAMAGTCNGCGDCRPRAKGERTCPVFQATGIEAATPRAKANLVNLLNGPTSAEISQDNAAEVAALCVNCKMCRDTCHAKIDVPKLMLEIKAARQAEHGLDWTDWVFARLEAVALTGSNFAPIVNALLARPSVRWVLEKVFGLSRHRRLPAFTSRSFLKRARGAGLTRKRGVRNSEFGSRNPSFRVPSSEIPPSPVALFVDIYPNFNDPLIAMAAVAILKHHGIEVYVPPRQEGCGMAPLTQGDIETARETAQQNIRIYADLVREGYTIVALEPTAALMLTQEYRNLVDDADSKAVAEGTIEITAYLAGLHEKGRLRTDFTRSLDATLGHHVPCHMKALHGPIAGPALLSLIPGLRVQEIDLSCSGMAGVYGMRAANYENSLAAGKPMINELNRPGVLFGSTECSACRLQMQEGTGKRTLHPVQYLAYAYGLMPEIGARLQQPLRDLVSE